MMRSSRTLCSLLLGLLLTTACFGQLGNVNLKPIDGMPFVNRNHRLGRGIVGMWLFNDRPLVLGTTRDLSGNSNHGTLVGDTYSVPGKFGNALEFDGDGDYVDLGIAGLSKTAATICIWVKPSDGWSNAEHFKGPISDTIIYDRALSAGEISDLYRDPFQMFKQERIPIAVAAAPPSGGRSFGVIIASIPFGIFGIGGIALAFGYSERKAA